MNTTRWALIAFGAFAVALTILRAWNRDTRGAFLIGIGVVLLGALFFVVGCAFTPERQPYMEIGFAAEASHTVGDNPACIVRIRQPIGFGKLEPDWLLVGFTHHSSCENLDDRNTIDQIEVMAKIPLGRKK